MPPSPCHEQAGPPLLFPLRKGGAGAGGASVSMLYLHVSQAARFRVGLRWDFIPAVQHYRGLPEGGDVPGRVTL